MTKPKKIKLTAREKRIAIYAYDSGFMVGAGNVDRSPMLTPKELSVLFFYCKLAVIKAGRKA